MNDPQPSLLLASFLIFVLASSSMACTEDRQDNQHHNSDPDVSIEETDASADDAEADPDADLTDTTPTPDTDEIEPDTGTLPPATLAEGIEITDIHAFQTVESTLVEDGAAFDNNIPIIAGRETLFRIFIAVDPGWASEEITAELLLTDPGSGYSETLTKTITIAANSILEERHTLFEIRVS